ncbi:MAG: Mov34/MPN/PAD-1 family protein [Candidatus Micrarchaeia archaeon]
MARIIIFEKALLSALMAAGNYYPNEFLGFFQGREGKDGLVLEELVIPPILYRNRTSVGYNDWQMPVLSGVKGTFHSHPWPPAIPSRADLELFGKKSQANFIACPPYGIGTVRAFDNSGSEISFEVRKGREKEIE